MFCKLTCKNWPMYFLVYITLAIELFMGKCFLTSQGDDVILTISFQDFRWRDNTVEIR